MSHRSSEALYGLGVIGALVYFLQQASTFTLAITGIIKAFFWPAFVVYRVFEYLKI